MRANTFMKSKLSDVQHKRYYQHELADQMMADVLEQETTVHKKFNSEQINKLVLCSNY